MRKLCAIIVYFLVLASMITGCNFEHAFRGSINTSASHSGSVWPTSCIRDSLPTISTSPSVTKPATVPESSVSAAPPNTDRYITCFSIDAAVVLALFDVQTVIAEMPLEYGVAIYDGKLFVRLYSGDCELSAVYGSTRYLCASYCSQIGSYSYLVDAWSGEVLDPLTALEPQVRNRMNEAIFSADAAYALILYNSNSAATLLQCATGESRLLPVSENAYSVSGEFIDQTHILLTTCIVSKDGQLNFEFSIYDVTTDTVTAVPGSYQKKNKYAENFIGMADDCVLFTYSNGKLAIIEPLTWEMTEYAFDEDAVVTRYTQNAYMVLTENGRYILHKNGDWRFISI